MLKEFKEFAFKGNVVDLAVGVVIGAAFGKIVTGVVNDLVMPVLSLVLPRGGWREAAITLRARAPDGPEGDVRLLWGDLLGVTLDFLVVAFILFLVIRSVNQLRRSGEAEGLTTRQCPMCLEMVPVKARRCRACTSDLSSPGTSDVSPPAA